MKMNIPPSGSKKPSIEAPGTSKWSTRREQEEEKERRRKRPRYVDDEAEESDGSE